MSKVLELAKLRQRSVIHIGVKPRGMMGKVPRELMVVTKLRVVNCGKSPFVDLIMVDDLKVQGAPVRLLGCTQDVDCRTYTAGRLEVGTHAVVSTVGDQATDCMLLSPRGAVIADLWVKGRG